MTPKFLVLAIALFALPAGVAASPAAPALGDVAATASGTTVVPAGSAYRRAYPRDCTPYAGPYGYYGNPWCEGGFTRLGQGWEIDLTPYVDGRAYRSYDRRYRRSRSY